MIWCAFDLCFGHRRGVATSALMQMETATARLQKQQPLRIFDAVGIITNVGTSAVHTAGHDLKILTRDGRDFPVAKNFSSESDTDRRLHQMAAVVKNSP
jgi:hypothetical protein